MIDPWHTLLRFARLVSLAGVIAIAVSLPNALAADTKSGLVYDYSHGFSHLWPLKYPADFTHFEYINTDAPRGGVVRIPILGTYDSFNAFIDRGREAAGMGFLSPTNLFYDRLMTGAEDEPISGYGRLAEGVKVADDYSWIAFKLRENAYWHDGQPITVDDVIFTFNAFKKDGATWVKNMINDVDRVEQIGPFEVRYVMKEGITPNPSMAQPIGVMPVIPKHYWETRDLSKTHIDPPLGSGPYRIKDFRIGRYVVYERIDNYWGEEVPVMKGRFNFQEIKYDYFRDTQVMLEATRGNLVDIQVDGDAKNWAVEYKFPAAREGLFKTELIPGTNPVGLSAPIFWNLRKERFRDIRVRKALWLLYDFEFINRVIHFDFFDRGRSVFHGAKDMEQSGLPSKRELELLEPFRDQLPPELFTQPYTPPKNSGYGINREYVEQAVELFEESGWVLQDGKLINAQTGERFRIDFVLLSHGQSRSLMPYIDQLERVGIETSIRVPEVSNWLYRMQTSAFDASRAHMPPYRVPGLALRNHFGSASAEQGFGVNWGYVRNPVIDSLAEHVIKATDRETFLAAVNAADRVLMFNYYFIPSTASAGTPLVYWDKFDRLETEPLERVPWLDGWWWNEDKAERIRQGLAAQAEEESGE